MNFAQLEYLVSLHNLKHFGKAAKENFVTQPTLSMMIKKLEEELGAEIFDRSKNPIRTTKLGLKIVEQARIVLLEQKKIKALTENETDSFEGDLSIALIPTLAPYVLPLILPKIQEVFPNLNLTIIEANTSEITQSIMEGKIDCAVLATPLSQDDITENHLYKEAFYLYSENDDLLSDINPKEIDMDRLILLEEGHCLRSQAINLCSRKKEYQGNTKYKIGSIETIINLVNQKQGSTIIPELAIHQLSKSEKKRIKRMKAPVPVRQISLIHHYTYHKKKLITKLVDIITTNVSPHLKATKNTEIIPL